MRTFTDYTNEVLGIKPTIISEGTVEFNDAFEVKDNKIIKVKDIEKAKAFKDNLKKDGNTWKFEGKNTYEIDAACVKDIEKITGNETVVAGDDGVPKVADVFKIEEKDDKKILTEILKDKEEDAKKFGDTVTRNHDKTIYFITIKDGSKKIEYTVGEKLKKFFDENYKDAEEKEVEKTKNPYNDASVYKLLGESFALTAINGITKGKMNKGIELDSKKLTQAVDSKLFIDRYKIVFKDIDIPDEYWEKHQVYDIMDDFAARSAFFEARDAKKISNEDDFVTKENDEIKEFNISKIKSDGATKAFYQKTLAEYQDNFDEGVKAAKEQCEKNKSGGTIKDPITKKAIEVPKESVIKQALKAMGSNVGNFLMDELGIANGKDIYSRMIRGIVGQFKDGSTVRKLLAKASAARYKQLKKLKVSVVKGHINETLKAIEDAKKNGGIPK